MTFKPLQDFILVEPIERFHSSVIAVVSHEKHCRGHVVAIGPGKANKHGKPMPIDAKPDDVIAFGDGNFDFYPKYYENGICYRIIQEADIAYIEEGIQ